MSDIPAITIVKRGCDKFPRFVVAKADEYKNPTYWTGSGWTADEAEARVFANVNDACWVHHDLMMEAVGDRPVYRYIAPVYIEIYGERPKLADLRAWLEKAVRIVVDSPKHGLGPDGTVGLMIFDAERTKSV